MKKDFALFIIIAVVIISFRQFFLQGLLPVPSDTLVGLYNPFRDFYSVQYPRGIPFKNFLITDPIRQQYPWRELTISLEKQFQLPLWNPYSFSGYPLLANFQSAAFYPLNVFFFFIPFSKAWSLLILLQLLVSGLFLYLYLRNIKLLPVAAFLGSVGFIFSGFSIAWLEWGTVLQTFMWVPLILLAIDMLNEKWTIRWMLVFIFAEISSLLAGHLQIWFYGLCVTNAYLFLQIFQKTKEHKKTFFFQSYLKKYFPFFIVSIGIFILTAIQWIPTLQFIFLSARNVDQNYLITPGWFIPWQNLLQFIFPDFFGNPTTLNYWGIWNYGELVGYIGILPLIFVFFAMIFRYDKKTYFWSLLFLTALIFSLPTPLAKLPYMLHIPLFSTSQPTRLLVIIDFSLAILAALGLDIFLKHKNIRKNLFIVLGMFLAIFIGVWFYVFKIHLNILPENIFIAKRNIIFPSVIFACLFSLLSLIIIFRKYISSKVEFVIFCVIIFISVIDLLHFAEKFTPFTPKEYLYPTTKTVSFLQKNIGNYRFMTTDSQILPPNVSDVYRLQSIEGYDPLYLENYGELVAAMQRNKPDISAPFGFNRIITPHDYKSPFINFLGVKYILTFDNISSKGYKKVFQEGKTLLYENKNVLPRTFFVSKVLLAKDKQDAVNKIFENKNYLKTKAIVQGKVDILQIGIGSIQIISYQQDNIILSTSSGKDGFLVLTDIYYPTWHAYIDGRETKIYITDFAFRGVVIPKGKHNVVFRDSLF